MKTITSASTFIACGHMVIECDGITILEAPDKSKIEKLVRNKHHLEEMDRLVGPEEFVQATGTTLMIAGQIFKPDRRVVKPSTKPIVHSFFKD